MGNEILSLLMPENELRIVRPDLFTEIIEEYFQLPRTKPIMVFHSDRNNLVLDTFHETGETFFGAGMVKTVRVADDNIHPLEAQIEQLASLPQKVIEIHYASWGINGYDDIILLAEKLAAVSGKFIILYCPCDNELSRGNDGRVKCDERVERCFDTWHNRMLIFVTDNHNNDFARHQEIYHACKCIGYIDGICCLLDKGDNNAAKKMLEEALAKRNTFTVQEEDKGNYVRFYATSAVPTAEERKLLEECHERPLLSMWYDVSKDDGEIIEYEHSVSNLIRKHMGLE